MSQDAAEGIFADALLAEGAGSRVTQGLPPSSYTDESIFAEELSRIFQEHWVFVGLKRELSSHQDFLGRTIGGIPVVLQNFHGALRAMRNVCSHRHSLIQTAERGCRPLQCSYHGWTYDADGIPVGIPGQREHFCFSDEARRDLALQQFEVAACDAFVFVRLRPHGPSLEASLGDNWELLQHLSGHFGEAPPIDEQQVPWETNWKIGVESVLEAYHVATVHRDSFQPVLSSTLPARIGGDHSSAVSLLRDEAAQWWDKVAGRLKLDRTPRSEGYDHHFIFPNLAIGLTRGALLSLQTYEPVTATQCLLRYRMILANTRPETQVNEAVLASVRTSVIETNRTILEEDRVASELAQRGLRHAVRRATLGLTETRIRSFHEALARRVRYAD